LALKDVVVNPLERTVSACPFKKVATDRLLMFTMLPAMSDWAVVVNVATLPEMDTFVMLADVETDVGGFGNTVEAPVVPALLTCHRYPPGPTYTDAGE
jgi:hypothetical protein